MLITIFTPTYNRAHLLPRLYDSLCKQTYMDFEWVIVDDGSTDNTATLIESLKSKNERSFPIRYYYQENGGKHRAINRGVKEAQGELFFIADSDDWLPDNALEKISVVFDDIRDDISYAGVCGLDGTANGTVVGSGLPKDFIDETYISVRYKHKIKGDMKEVFRTSVFKDFPFPEIENEKFCPEALVWNRIGKNFKLRYFNEVIYLIEYQNDGITASIIKARMKSPIASMMTYAEIIQFKNVPLLEKCKSAINYWRFYLCAIRPSYKPKIASIWRLFYPIGMLMHLRDLRLTR